MIKELICNMLEQLQDAQKYAILAIKYKIECPTASAMYKHLSEQQLQHQAAEQKLLVERLNDKEDKCIWQWQHEDIIKHKSEIKAMHELL